MFGLTPYERRNHSLFDSPFDALQDFENAFFRSAVPQMRCDIQEKENEYELVMDLPGFTKDDVKITAENGMLTIQAEKDENNENKDKDNYVRRERRYGSVQRSFSISGIDEQNITAAFENGVLTLTLPKEKEQQPTSRQIEIH